MRHISHSSIVFLAFLMMFAAACSRQEAPAAKPAAKPVATAEKQTPAPPQKTNYATGDKALLSLGLQAIADLTPAQRKLLGAYISIGPRAFIGQLSELSPVTRTALRNIDPNGVLKDTYLQLMNFSLAKPVRGDFSAINDKNNLVYVDRSLEAVDFVGPALMMPFPLLYDKNTTKRTAYSTVMLDRQTYLPLDAALGARLEKFFSPHEGFLGDRKATDASGMTVSIEGLKEGDNTLLKVHLANTTGAPVVLPVLNPPIDPSADRRGLMGKIGLYRQIAWILEDKNGDVVGYSRPMGILDLKKGESNQLANLSEKEPGQQSILMLPNQGDIWNMTNTAGKIHSIGPFTLTACVTSLMSKADIIKQWPDKTKDLASKTWFDGWVCSDPVTIDKPLKPGSLRIPAPSRTQPYDGKTLREILTAH